MWTKVNKIVFSGYVLLSSAFAFGGPKPVDLNECRIFIPTLELDYKEDDILNEAGKPKYSYLSKIFIKCGKQEFNYVSLPDMKFYIKTSEEYNKFADLYLHTYDENIHVGILGRNENEEGELEDFFYIYLFDGVSYENFKIVSERKYTTCLEEYGLKETNFWVKRHLYFEIFVNGKYVTSIDGYQDEQYFSIPFVCIK